MKQDKTFKVLFVIAVIAFVVIVYISQNREMNNDKKIKALIEENKTLILRNDSMLVIQDSLDSLIEQINPISAIVIEQKIITKYEKEFTHIDTLNADHGFIFFSRWISEDDCYKK